MRLIKLFLLLLVTLLLNACGGGGGGGAGGGAASYTVSNCSDTGTAYQDAEYRGFNSAYHSLGPLSAVCASSAYARGATGDGIQIAVVDTGIDADHHEINGNLVSFTSGSDLVNSDDDPADDHGHGSHVAGIIAAEHNNNATIHGVAYDADLYIFKAFNSSGSGTDATTGGAFGKIEAIAAIDIVNNSWGTDADCSSASACRTAIGSTTYDNWEDMSQLSTPKISVFAAGNDSESEPSAECQTMAYNTDISAVSVCVVAVSHSSLGTDGGLLADFSNQCGKVAAYCIAAPGDRIYSLTHLGSYTYKSGTSMAAPMVSGGLALIMQEFSSLTPAQVVSRLLTTANDTSEYSQTAKYGHGLMNLNAATTAIAELQTINGSNLLDDPNTSYNDLVNNSFTSSAAFSNALNNALTGQTMEVYDSFDRANFEVGIDSFFTSGSYTSQNTIENHMARLKPKSKQTAKQKNLYGSFTVETDGNYIESSMFQSAGNFLALGYNQSTNSFENAVDPLSNFFNDSNFGNNYLINPYFNIGSGQDYFMSFNNNGSFGFDSFTKADGNDLGLAFNLNPLSSSDEGMKNAGDLQLVFGTNYEQNKFLNSNSSGVFSTGDLSNTNFTGIKYKKNLGGDFTFVGSGFAGYTYIDKAANSYIDNSTPLLTSSFTLGLAKANFIKEDQRIGFFINQPQRVEDGSLNLRVPTSSDRDRTVTYSNLNVDLEPNARQINLDIVFNKIITESSNLSANLTHVQNGDHSENSKNQNFISLLYKKSF